MKLKVMSWNIWQGKYFDKIIETIKTNQPDIIGLLEVDEGITTNTADMIAKKFGYYQAYYRTFEKNRDGEHYLQGNAILSKFKIIAKSLSWLNRDIVFDGTSKTEPRAVVQIKSVINNRQLNIFATHLAHIHNFGESKIQMIQTEELLKKIPENNSLLMGDFNVLPKSKIIKKIEKVLLNTDSIKDKNTWSVYPKGHKGCKLTGLDYRLDYIFTSIDIKTLGFETIDSKGSDHLPVMAIVEV